MGVCLRGVSADEIPVQQVMFPPLLDGIQIPHWGREIVRVGGGLKGDGWEYATLLDVGIWLY